jgi:PHD/YefM family antitoxin component YafN of YafNO toxin-antitoxin module
MTTVTIRAGDVRLPQEARRAVERHDPVTVTERDRSAYVIINAEDFAYVSPLLEQRRRGLPVPIEQLLTDEDYAVLALDEAEDAVAGGIAESWND